ncbi:MAG: hypothetical protein K2M19_05750 [Muribaculaceae bacterium]|nr:hypothetical protein [Muribaculaceae bacterium]
MNNQRFFIIILFVLGFYAAFAQDPVVTVSTKIANQGSYVSDYNSEFKLIDGNTDLTWTVQNFNNNNSAWNDIRCGSRDAPTTATITTDFAIPEAIGRVVVDVTRYKSGSTNRMTSMELLVSPEADMTDASVYQADISMLPEAAGTPVNISIPVNEPEENMYYQLKIEMPKVSSAGVFSVNSLSYYPVSPEPVVGAYDVSLDFTNQESLLQAYISTGSTIAPGSEYAETGTNNLNGASFKVEDVTVSLDKSEGTIVPRWWESKTIAPELRLNPDNTMTFRTNTDNCYLTEVKFVQGTSADSYFNDLTAKAETNLGASVFTDHKWAAPADDKITDLTLTFENYSRCGGIKVSYYNANEGMSGAATIAVGPEDANVSETEYFTLQGVKTDRRHLTTGLYITRRGSVMGKIYIK